jgi:hypothetical protein
MKGFIASVLIALAVAGVTTQPASAAKATYCKTALVACMKDCESNLGWNEQLVLACSTGCNLGYLFC